MAGERQTPIAVVGMACRLPGNSNSPEQFWRFLLDGKIADLTPPASRFNLKGHYDGTLRKWTMRSPGGMFINADPKDLDAGFFGLSQVDAVSMDPQQRQLLEVVYEGLENAGLTMESIKSRTFGCFVGHYSSDYSDIQTRDPEDRTPSYGVGCGRAMLSNRISHFLDIKGPSMTIDTACSGSLVSLDVACRYLDSGDADGAIVGGCSLYMSPEQNMDQSAMLAAASASGRCWTFDARADGYIKAEAINCLILKRLDDALRDGDPIRAVIRGSSTNSDGWTPGIASPSSEAQAVAIRRAYARAGITNFADTAYLECHGTGTLAGDPIECRAASSVFSASRTQAAPLRIGSVKSNIGHSEPAAGVSGMIKAVLTVERGIIPGNPTFEIPNPNIDFSALKISPSKAATSWPQGMMRRASVNSFGYGGSNAHVIVEHPEVLLPGHQQTGVSSYVDPTDDLFADEDDDQDASRRLLVFSANDEVSLKASVKELLRHLSDPAVSVNSADLAYTLSQRRTRHFHRAYTIANGHNFRESQVVYGKLDGPSRVGLVFTGQGAQWPQMGRELLEKFPLARMTVQQLDRALQSMSDPPTWSLLEELVEQRSAGHMRLPKFSQPLVTALQLALLAVLKEWGLEYSAVVGHSSGEIAAAVAAGCLLPEDGIKVAYLRGKAAEDIQTAEQSEYGMLAVGLGSTGVANYLSSYPNVRIACYNSPKSVTLSGFAPDLSGLEKEIQADGHFARRLMVDLAYHSEYMKEIAEHYRSLLVENCPSLEAHQKSSDVQFFSTVHGRISEQANVDYWVLNMMSPVLFDQGVMAMVQQGSVGHLVELGPSGALAGPIKQIKQAVGHGAPVFEYTAAFARGEDSTRPLLDLAGKLFFSGVGMAYDKVGDGDTKSEQPRVIIDLPTYQWNHSIKYWHESLASKDWRYRPFPAHDLLGTKVLGQPWSAPTFKRTLRLRDVPWIRDHMCGADIIFPASAYISMAVEAVFQMAKSSELEFMSAIDSVDQGLYVLRDVRLLRALVVGETADHFLYLSLGPVQGPAHTWYRFEISTLRDDAWTAHCRGLVRINPPPAAPSSTPVLEPLVYPSPAARWYKPLKRVGFNFGPKFRNLVEIEAVAGQRTSRAKISIPPVDNKQSKYAFHPAVLDSFFQAVVPALNQGQPALLDKMLVPRLIDNLTLYPSHQAPTSALATTSSHFINGRPDKAENFKVNAIVHEETSAGLLADIRGLHFTELDIPGVGDEVPSLMKLGWEADICQLRRDADLEILASSNVEAAFLADGLRLPETAAYLLALLRHKAIAPAVLDLDMLVDKPCEGQTDTVALEHYLSSLGRYSYVSRTAERFTDAQTRLQGMPGTDYNIYDATAAGADEPPFAADEKFDMVILRLKSSGYHIPQPALDFAHKLCSQPGFLVLVQDSAPSSTTQDADIKPPQVSESIDSVLQSAGFSIQASTCLSHPSASGTSSTIYLCTPSLPQHSRDETSDFPLVDLSSGTSKECSALIESLRGTGWVGNVTELSSASSIPLDKPILLVDNPQAPLLANIAEPAWNNLRSLLKADRKLLWLTSGSQMTVTSPLNALIHGFARSLRGEEPTLVLKTLDASSLVNVHAISSISRLMKTFVSPDDAGVLASENEYCERGGVLYISRVRPDRPLIKAAAIRRDDRELESISFRQYPKTVRLWCERIGAMGSLHFNELPNEPESIDDGELEVDIKAAGVNYKDIATSLGLVPEDEYRIGYESAGIVRRVGKNAVEYKVGDRVAVLSKGSFANRVRMPKESVFLLPDGITFEEGATMSLVFFTVVYSLMEIANVQRGQSVLIHSATGGVGLAAIQLCRYLGAEIYATVGNQDKRRFLIEEFGIPTERIFSSRTTDFAEGIRTLTNGRGVDFVLNSLTGDLLDESWRLLADHGMLLEIGKRDIVDRNSLPMEPFDRNCSYKGIDIVKPSIADNLALLDRTMRTIRSLLEAGHIRPISPRKVFSFKEIPDALRYMRSGEHMGKIVISDGGLDDVKVPVRRASPSIAFAPQHSYLIVGGLRGLCGSLAIYMARQGAKHLTIMSRSGADDIRSRQVLRDLQSLGATIKIEQGDVSNLEDVKRVFQSSPVPIKGVVQGAMVLRDKTLEAMTVAEYHEALACKVAGTWNLHYAAAEVDGSKLEFFTMLSSISGMVGTASQANYAAGNSFQDAFALYRQSLGFSAHSVNLGIIEDVGYMSEHQGLTERVSSRSGLSRINERELHDICRLSILQQTLGLSCESAGQMITGLPFPLSADSPLVSDARFGSMLVPQHSQASNVGDSKGDTDGTQAFQAMIRASLPAEQLVTEACRLVSKQLVQALGLAAEVEESKPLSTYGIDSLAAVDLRNWFKVRLSVELTTLDVLNATNLRSLCTTAVGAALEALRCK